jgi:hypothetical protein
LRIKIENFIYPFTFRIFKGEKMLFEILAFIIGLIYSAATAIGMFITVIILVVVFIVGTFIGDILEVAIKKAPLGCKSIVARDKHWMVPIS